MYTVSSTRRLLLLLPMVLAACTATGPLYQPPPTANSGYATLVLMRASAFAGRAWAHDWYLNGKQVASLRDGGYTYLFVKEGEWDVSLGAFSKDGLSLRVSLKSGATYYIEESMGAEAGYGVVVRHGVQVLDPTAAEQVLPAYRYSAPTMGRVD